ncbi:MAG: hypothetical protein K9K35_10020 [Rhodoferax sp.]|nr:hypothetical protein [Rhodoferax sp.]
MTTLTQMREAAALLPTDDPVRKALIWADMELGDRYDQICELEEENDRLCDENNKLVQAMQAAKELIDSVSADLRNAIWQPAPPAVDHAPFKNIMAAHGVEPYAKAKRKAKAVAA